MHQTQPLPPSTVRLLLAGILLLAAALRFAGLGVIPGFNGDEGLDLFYARQVVEHGSLRLHPVRPYFGPYQLWLTAPFLKLFGFTPLAARLVPAAAGVGATWLAWRLGRRWGGELHGLAGAALLGLAPWFVGYSRVGLSVCLVPAATVLVWWLLVRLMDRPSPLAAATTGMALGFAVVLHPTGLLLGPALVAAALLHPTGRSLLRRPGVLAGGLAGFALTGWIAWDLLLAQVGLGPGVDLSLTHVDARAAPGLLARLGTTASVALDTAAGGRALEWLSGTPTDEHLLLRPLGGAVIVCLLLALVRAVRERDPTGLGLLAAIAITGLLTAVRSDRFDLAVISRERYVLVPVTLTFLALPYGLVGGGRWMGERRRRQVVAAVVAVWCGLAVAGIEVGMLRPMRTTGGTPAPSMITALPDAKLQAARLMLARTAPDEEGLLLAGDGWSYWSLLGFLGERMPADFVPEDPEACAVILTDTRHRRRYLADFAGGSWVPRIRDCLGRAGYSPQRDPLFIARAPDGRPILLLWELPPEGPAPTAPPPGG